MTHQEGFTLAAAFLALVQCDTSHVVAAMDMYNCIAVQNISSTGQYNNRSMYMLQCLITVPRGCPHKGWHIITLQHMNTSEDEK